jgi:hypothetical protein
LLIVFMGGLMFSLSILFGYMSRRLDPNLSAFSAAAGLICIAIGADRTVNPNHHK